MHQFRVHPQPRRLRAGDRGGHLAGEVSCLTPPGSDRSGKTRTGGADLHVHSHYSDGSYSPAEIVRRSSDAGLSTVALTDHDTVAGIKEFTEAAEGTGVSVVPGVEISCELASARYHVLGYCIDWTQRNFVERLKHFEEARADRIRRMVQVLENEDIDISFDEIENLAGKSLIGKPHVAQALVNHGVVSSVREAFETYLGDDQLLDRVPKDRMNLEEAVSRIRDAGGIPVLAHPIHYEDDLDLERFRDLGIQGLEVYYSDHTEEHSRRYRERAEDLGLLITGGSDFHGDVKPEVDLGDFRLDEAHVERLRKEAAPSGAGRRRQSS